VFAAAWGPAVSATAISSTVGALAWACPAPGTPTAAAMASAAATPLRIDVLRIFGLRRSSLSLQRPRCKSMKHPFHSRPNDPLTASALRENVSFEDGDKREGGTTCGAATDPCGRYRWQASR
jgi:hypothetical protein